MSEAPSVCTEKYVVARKQHICCECKRTILPGDRYQLFKGCWDGEWDDYKTCCPCADLRDTIGSLYRSDEYPEFGGLSEEAIEHGYDFVVYNQKGKKQ